MAREVACLLGITLLASPVFAAPTARDPAEFFESKIRPVLAEKCYSCHSANSKKIKGDLTVDTAAGLLKGGESGSPAVVPDHPEKSKLLDAIEYKSDDLQMPPKEKLPPEVIANFQTWISMGAPDPRSGSASSLPDSHLDIAAQKKHWWAFIPPKDQAPPTVKESSLVKTPVDQFVLAKLESKGLSYSPPADKRTLIRRATFDLIGLPPTSQEVADFEADESPSAFEKVIDRLLASPQYGERWGRYWLDVARYSDTKGYVFQEERRYPFAYTYRDWVVNAFNTDLSYKQFIVDQLAADRLDLGSDKHPLAAMGFLTVGRRFLNSQPDIIDDRIDVTCRGFLAMTVGCARCHDHKFDPIPTKDYYSLYSIFANSIEPKELPEIEPSNNTPARAAFDAKVAAAKEEMRKYRESRLTQQIFELRTADSVANHLLAARDANVNDLVSLKAEALKYTTRFILITRWQQYLKAKTSVDPIWAAWTRLGTLTGADFTAAYSDALAKTTNPLIHGALQATAPKSAKALAKCYGEVIAKYAATTPAKDANQEAIRLVLMGKDSPTSLTDAELDKASNQEIRNKLTAYQKKLDAIMLTDPGAGQRAMVMNDSPQLHPDVVFKRGNPQNPGDVVPRAFLSVLSPTSRPTFDKDSGRLEMAEAIASNDNPLTARVIVNRIWGHHFGQAIVRTPSDFGHRGEMPTNPELLDYLALRFEHDGWSIKKMQKLIMMSAVYQQGSDDDDAKRLIDPENVLLWKFNRQRLDFEAMRDSLLAVSGQLDSRLGGQSVDIFSEPFSDRRSVYGFIDRQNLPGVLRAFDFASPDAHSPQRHFTTVPQQALFMMNSPFVMQAAKSVVNRDPIAGENDPRRKIQLLYQTVLDRNPTDDEMAMGLVFLHKQSQKVTAVPPTPIWRYGYGEYDQEAEHTKAFHPFTHFVKNVWQRSAELPDSEVGFAMLTPTGGHPGNDLQHAVIRRWTAPCDGVVAVNGALARTDVKGDGVHGRVVSSRSGLLGEWTVETGSVATSFKGLAVHAGETVDFIVDCRANPDFDSFNWAPVVTLSGEKSGTWDAQKDFSGKDQATPDMTYNAWDKYAQVLLETNEFVFVD
jgi:hypothetical protein